MCVFCHITNASTPVVKHFFDDDRLEVLHGPFESFSRDTDFLDGELVFVLGPSTFDADSHRLGFRLAGQLRVLLLVWRHEVLLLLIFLRLVTVR